MARSGIFVDPVPGTPPTGTAAQDARLALSGLIGSTSRLVSGGGVTQSASTMQVTVAAAVWQLPDVTSTATFLSATDSTVLTPAAGPSTGSRIDSIAVKQNNYANGDADSRVNVVLLPGVSAGSPVPPSLPAGYFRYANITVPTNAANAAACTVTILSPQTAAPLPILSPTLALLNTVTGSAGQTAVVTSDTAANNRMWFWSATSNTWVHALNNSTVFAEATGVGSNPNGAYGAVTFPAGRFTVAPLVYLQILGSAVAFPLITSVTTTGFSGGAFSSGGSAVAGSWNWHAIQMTPTTAVG